MDFRSAAGAVRIEAMIDALCERRALMNVLRFVSDEKLTVRCDPSFSSLDDLKAGNLDLEPKAQCFVGPWLHITCLCPCTRRTDEDKSFRNRLFRDAEGPRRATGGS